MTLSDVLLTTQIMDIAREHDPGLYDHLIDINNIKKVHNIPATESQLKYMLTYEDFIIYGYHIYVEFVKVQFHDNSIMTNKWLRYAHNIKYDNL
jgi:hypothetical protein